MKNKKIGFILIRGLARQSAHWLDFENYLREEIPECEIFYYEQPGFGKRVQESFPLTIARAAEDLLNETHSLDNNITWIPVGISLGGMIVMHLLAKKKFKKGIIINSSVANISIYKRLKPLAMKEFMECFIIDENKLRESKIFEVTCNLADKKKSVEKWIEIAIANAPEKETVIRQLFAASTFRLPNIKRPLLILAAKKDKLCSFEASSYIYKNIENSHMELHKSAGHDLSLDDPRWCSKKIREFVLE